MNKIYLNECNTKELSESISNGQINKVIVPFGSCEAHGPHLPLGTDIFIPDAMAKKIAENTKGTIIAPSVSFGTSISYNKYPLSITLRYETTIKLAEDIIESLILNNLKKIIILNGHDLNISPLEIAARNMKDKYKSCKILIVPGWWFYSRTVLKEKFQTWDGRGHGGEAETSLILSLKPELVDLDSSDCQINERVNEINKYGNMMIWDIDEVTNTGSTGDSTSATVEKGELLFEEFTNYLIELINSLDSSNWKY